MFRSCDTRLSPCLVLVLAACHRATPAAPPPPAAPVVPPSATPAVAPTPLTPDSAVPVGPTHESATAASDASTGGAAQATTESDASRLRLEIGRRIVIDTVSAADVARQRDHVFPPIVVVRRDAAAIVWDAPDSVRFRLLALDGSPTGDTERTTIPGTDLDAGLSGTQLRGVFVARGTNDWAMTVRVGLSGTGTDGTIVNGEHFQYRRSATGWSGTQEDDEADSGPFVSERVTVDLDSYRLRPALSDTGRPFRPEHRVEDGFARFIAASDDALIAVVENPRREFFEVGFDGHMRGALHPPRPLFQCVAAATAWACAPESAFRAPNEILFVPHAGSTGSSVARVPFEGRIPPAPLIAIGDVVAVMSVHQLLLADASGRRSAAVDLGPGYIGSAAVVPGGLLVAHENQGRIEVISVGIRPAQ